MDKEPKGLVNQLKSLFSKKQEGTKSKKLFQYAVIILIFGISLMAFEGFIEKDDSGIPASVSKNTSKNEDESSPVFGQSKESEPITMTDYERRFENDLKDTLESIVGVDDVSVMVNIDETAIKVFEKNSKTQTQLTKETDSEGGKRDVRDETNEQQLVIVRNGDQEVPVLVKTLKPSIRGVLIVASGAENIHVKKMILDAVTKVLDVPIHKVSVLPKKLEGES